MLGNRYVAMIDILGFKQLVASEPLSEVALKVQTFVKHLQPYTSQLYRGKIKSELPDPVEIGSIHFSDTILLWTPPISEEDPDLEAHYFFSLAWYVGDAIFFSLVNGIPLRGGIAFGESYVDSEHRIIFGPAIVDAHITEQSQDWIGAAVHSSCMHRPRHRYLGHHLVRYHIPIKPGQPESSDVAVDWTWPLRGSDEIFQRMFGFSAHQAFNSAIGSLNHQFLPAEVARKYSNTQAFIAEQIKTRPIYEGYSEF